MRLILAIWLGKLVYKLTRLSQHGGGSAGPGYYALKIHPGLVKELAKKIPQNIVITGTNGKTTTARLLSHFIASQKIQVIRNSTGSNLERGIASALIAHTSWTGKIEAEIGIWELDEAAFNTVVFQLKPQIIVFLNAFRDQLDRYGEVDSVVQKWRASLTKMNWSPAIVVNGGDNHTWSLTDGLSQQFYEFRVKDHQLTQEKRLTSSKKHQDDFVANITKNKGLSGLDFDLKFPDKKMPINLPIPGIYHIYDFLAAFAVYYLLNLPIKDINDHLQSYLPAFGRVEKIKLQKNEGYVFLIKNPVGASQVLETLAPEIKPKDRLLIALNDNFADGLDVSWIWDASFETLLNSPSPLMGEGRGEGVKVICSGARAQDLALRLKYAGINNNNPIVINELKKALFAAQDGLTGCLFILPTYTALLELQKLLADLGIKQHYWKEN